MLVEMSLNASLNTLKKMSFGGLHDHVGKVRLISSFSLLQITRKWNN